MNRRNFLSSIGFLPQVVSAYQQARGRTPNIVFILADDLGWGDSGCYGHPQIKTPALDRLASQGTLFTQFYVNAPVCSPSRTAFMTGHYPARHRVHGHFAGAQQNQQRGMPNWLDPAVPTVASTLKKVGYTTAHFGKWHLGGGEGAPDPSKYGFDVHRTVNSTGPGWEDENDKYFRARSTELIVDETVKFARANRNNPFYVNVWSLLPHATLNPTDEQTKEYARLRPGGGVPERGALQIFYSTVTALDKAIGRLLAQLDEMKLSDDTLVLFSSDNGPEDIHILNASHSGVGTPGPFRGRKRSLYEGGVRLPFLVRWPNHVPAGRVDDSSVLTAVDFLPTLSKVAAVNPPDPASLDGENVLDILEGKSRPRTKPILWEWRFNIAGEITNKSPMLSIRDGNWKLLMNPDRSRVELYDIPHDPTELNNLADRQPELVKRMSERVLAWQKTLPAGPIEPAAGKNNYNWPRASKM